MSNQAWAIQIMMKYRLQVDFSQKTIDCRGFNSGWFWKDDSDFYKVLNDVIIDIERLS